MEGVRISAILNVPQHNTLAIIHNLSKMDVEIYENSTTPREDEPCLHLHKNGVSIESQQGIQTRESIEMVNTRVTRSPSTDLEESSRTSVDEKKMESTTSWPGTTVSNGRLKEFITVAGYGFAIVVAGALLGSN